MGAAHGKKRFVRRLEGITSIFFVDATYGWATSGDFGTIFYSTDGGASWGVQFISFPIGGLSGITLIDNNMGWPIVPSR